jgi:CRP-like cAMP-binding protein
MSALVQPEVHSKNQLLCNLPSADLEQIFPHLSSVRLDLGDVITEGAADYGYAYFPTSCVVSLTCAMENGATAQVGIIGNDGVLGTSVFLGGSPTSHRAIVGMAGDALRIDARALRKQFLLGGAFQQVLLRYTSTLISQISLTAACNRTHTFEKRLCRWLLLIRDRTASNDLFLTQEFIANTLGGRRETATVAVGRLQNAGLISITRGHLCIMDRDGLEEAACECYTAVIRDCNYRLPPHRASLSTKTRDGILQVAKPSISG